MLCVLESGQKLAAKDLGQPWSQTLSDHIHLHCIVTGGGERAGERGSAVSCSGTSGSRRGCRIHQTLRVTPAMEAGIADHVWTVEEIVGLVPEEDVVILR